MNISTNTRVALICGPLNCGKDKAIDFAIEQGLPLVRRECKGKLHALTQELFCISAENYWKIYNNRKLKERPLPEFTVTFEAFERLAKKIAVAYDRSRVPASGNRNMVMLSIREAVIYVSECVAKPTMGQDYFGRVRAESIQEGEYVVDGSCGFPGEIPPTLKRVGAENVLLIRVKGRGQFAPSDSRNYIPDGVVPNTIDIWNTKSEAYYLNLMYTTLTNFFGGK